MPCALLSSSCWFSSSASGAVGDRNRQQIVEQFVARPALAFQPLLDRCTSLGGSAVHAAWRAVGGAPRRCLRRPADARSFVPAWRSSDRAWPTCPCRFARLPRSPQASPTNTLLRLVRAIQALVFMSPLRIIGPASMADVHLVAGAVEEARVDERHALRARAIQAVRLTLVRRSSSMMPILTVLRGSPSSLRRAANSSLANATSAGPCILGLTM